jgi:hypothetical protein
MLRLKQGNLAFAVQPAAKTIAQQALPQLYAGLSNALHGFFTGRPQQYQLQHTALRQCTQQFRHLTSHHVISHCSCVSLLSPESSSTGKPPVWSEIQPLTASS